MTQHIAIVGAGIVGMSHAVAALSAGYRVTVLEQDERAVLASVQNFGHVCTSVQAGELADLAREANPLWLQIAERAGLTARVSGTLVVARTEAEEAVLTEVAEERAPEGCELLPAVEAAAKLRLPAAGSIRAALLHPGDITADPRTTVARIAAWVAEQELGEMRFGITVRSITERAGTGGATIETNRGPLVVDRVIVAAGHLIGRLFPELAGDVRECVLQMARVRPPHDMGLGPAVLTGTSMLRYGIFAGPAQDALRREFVETRPEMLDIDANVMFTQQADGTLLVGDSHHLFDSAPPFLDERCSELLLADAAELLGVPEFEVIERWQGRYAMSGERELLREEPIPGVSAVSVTSGIGMTIAPALGARTIAEF